LRVVEALRNFGIGIWRDNQFKLYDWNLKRCTITETLYKNYEIKVARAISYQEKYLERILDFVISSLDYFRR